MAGDADAKAQNRALCAYWLRCKVTFRRRYPLPDGSTWVSGRLANGVFSVGCRVCARAGSGTPLARFGIIARSAINTHVLTKHQDTAAHKEALLGQESVGAPSAEQFLRVLRAPCSVPDDLGAKKQAVMRWCLSEAKMDIERAAMSQATNTMMSQDASKGDAPCGFPPCYFVNSLPGRMVSRFSVQPNLRKQHLKIHNAVTRVNVTTSVIVVFWSRCGFFC